MKSKVKHYEIEAHRNGINAHYDHYSYEMWVRDSDTREVCWKIACSTYEEVIELAWSGFGIPSILIQRSF